MHPFMYYVALKRRQNESGEFDRAVRGRDRRTRALGTRSARRARSLAAADAYRVRAAAPGLGL